jgi:DNA-binding response OmpR family regulator
VNERILIIDDDLSVQDIARSSLERDGYMVHTASGGDEGLALIAARSPALLVLDLGLPDIPGETVLQEIRRRSQIPIIVLSARGRMEERVKGLGLGADDYLPKPFSPLELVARCCAAPGPTRHRASCSPSTRGASRSTTSATRCASTARPPR